MVARRSPAESANAPTLEALEEALAKRSAEIEALRARIDQIESDRAEFFSDAAHAIGNPLTVIHSYLEILHTDLHEGLTKEQGSFLRIAYENANRLRQLVDDIMLLVALDAGDAQIDLALHPADRIIASVCSEMKPVAERRNQGLTTEIAKDLPPVNIDESRLKDVLLRLVDNAIRFTPDGGSISVLARTEPSSVLIIVRDSGAGMAEEGIDDALRTFVQLHRSPGSSRNGYGLGLPLCQRQVEAMGGSFELKSIEGEGTSVTIRIQVPETEDPG